MVDLSFLRLAVWRYIILCLRFVFQAVVCAGIEVELFAIDWWIVE